MNKKYAIFDMDGTLVDSMPAWRGLIREYLTSMGVTDIPDDIIEKVKHLPTPETSKLLVRTFHLNLSPEEVEDTIHRIMAQHYANDVALKKGIVEYLDKLQSRGVRMAVATATAMPLVEVCMEKVGIRHYFETIQSCYTLKVGKQEPDVYDACVKLLGTTRDQAAVFEDSLRATRTAKAAGYYTVGIYDRMGESEWPELRKLADEIVIDWTKAE